MSRARLVITAVVVEGLSPAEVAATYGVSRSWVYELVARYRTEGDTAFEPRSKRPHSSPTALDPYGKVSLRHDGRLHHIGIGRTHARTPVLLLVAELDIRIIDAATGELLRHLTLDPTTDYQPLRTPRPKNTPN